MNKLRTSITNLGVLLLMIGISNMAYADEIEVTAHKTTLLFYLGVIFLSALAALVIVKLRQPTVLGQLLAGSLLAILAHYNIGLFDKLPSSKTLAFLAELGGISLLFEIGLESNLTEIKNAGMNAAIVALTGVIMPFILGYYIVTPLISATASPHLALFIGSVLAVTSTGISVSVFKDLGIFKHPIGQIVLAASVIDDVIGLILLSITTGLIIVGHINLTTTFQTFGNIGMFFVVSFAFGLILLPKIIAYAVKKINNSRDMLILALVTYAIFMSWFASVMGLASIIGAFLAGLLVEEEFFHYSELCQHNVSLTQAREPTSNYLVDSISPIGKILIPIFFIFAGLQVDIIAALNWQTIKLTIIITVFAVIGKSVCGMFLPKNINKWIVGFGMVPRGEIGIIFALSGLELKVIDHTMFAAILLMVIITSIITPIALNFFYSRFKYNNGNISHSGGNGRLP